jgi:group II intron reverse transcriptase/maturase
MRKEREMRTADDILSVIRDRGTRGLPLERVYRLLFNRDLYLRAYARLYPNQGAMTKGSTPETVDGMSLAKIDKLIDDIRYERHRWTPVRRVNIPKPNGKMRPLGIPSWSDKLLQEVMRSILEAYYNPQFSDHSHGFRPNRGCHTALQTIRQKWTGTRLFIEGDIKQYFDTINHDTLIEILRKNIHDERFLRLIRELLAAGYMEDWKFNKTLSGAPQGGVISPLLSNIYLNEFDQWVEKTLIPEYTRGKQKPNPAYKRVADILYRMRKLGQTEEVKELQKQLRKLPTKDTKSANYRRLRYIRYADDFLLGFVGTYQEAREIKQKIKEWLLNKLGLELSEEKTLITHATKEKARFLGYEIITQYADDKIDKQGQRAINGNIALRVPADVVKAKCTRYIKHDKAQHRTELINESDYTIVTLYQQEYRGIVQYYALAQNVAWLSRLHWVMQSSLLKTLAAKHHTSVAKERQRLETTTTDSQTGHTLKCLEVRVERTDKKPLVARFGGISLIRKPWAILDDQPQVKWNERTELLQRLLADECENCGSHDNIEVHHVRKLADLLKRGRKEKPHWVRIMIARQRKTLVLCRKCHVDLHAGRLQWQKEPE